MSEPVLIRGQIGNVQVEPKGLKFTVYVDRWKRDQTEIAQLLLWDRDDALMHLRLEDDYCQKGGSR